jgi:phosphatidylserine synthase
MTGSAAYLLAIGVTFVVNVPFGYWRAGVRKFSPQWFLAVHAAVPVVIALRLALSLPFRWHLLPLFVIAYFGGQLAGSRLHQRRAIQPNRP